MLLTNWNEVVPDWDLSKVDKLPDDIGTSISDPSELTLVKDVAVRGSAGVSPKTYRI